MLKILLVTLILSLVLNLIFFIFAFKNKTDKFTDITYSMSFILITLIVYYHSNRNVFSVLATFMVLIWAIRLGGFLLYRVVKNGKDNRFDVMRENFFSFAKFWMGQAIVAWALMIPIIILSSSTKNFSLFSILGIIIWLIGLIIESLADFQKYIFRLNPKNKNKWINSGLWRYSRHPNYFGEILVWVGIYIFSLPALSILGKAVALISSLLIILLLRYVSGVPLLEKSGDKKWGNNPDYIKYKKATNLIIPFVK